MIEFGLRKNCFNKAAGAETIRGLTFSIATLLLTMVLSIAAWADDVHSYIGKEYWTPGLQFICPTLGGWTKGEAGCFDIDGGVHFKIINAIHTDDLIDPNDIRDYFVIAFDDGTKAFIHQSDVTSSCCELTEPPGTEEARKLAKFSADLKAEDAKKQADAIKAKAVCDKKGGVSIGMTEQQAIATCWGRSREKHSTTTASGTEEQWVYGGENYLYFANGILVSIQN